jgi:hypothetical protein
MTESDKTYVKNEIKKFILENYLKYVEYGDKVLPLAFEKWFMMMPFNSPEEASERHHIFYEEIYPILKIEMGITDDDILPG